MTQLSILAGIYVDASPDFRSALPLNYVPTPKDTGINKGYIRPGDGLVELVPSPYGIVRGSINWQGVCYQVQGNSLVKVNANASLTKLGAIAGTGTVTMDYSFSMLGIASGGVLYYFDGLTVTPVMDPDIGYVVDMMFIDGYWLVTDGSYIAQSELTDPFSFNPLKYGSSEADPDPINALWRLKDEMTAINRYTTETFENVGGTGFAFQRVSSALVMAGSVGTHMVCELDDNLALVGGGRNETPSVWAIGGGDRIKLATAEIDHILQNYTEQQLSLCLLEGRVYLAHQQIMLHLPDRTLVYDLSVTKALGVPIWFELGSAVEGSGQYRAQHWTWVYDKWVFGDPQVSRVGTAVETLSSHYGQQVGWQFNTQMLYNDGMGAVVHQLELVVLPGRVPLGITPTVWTSYSKDGETWSQERPLTGGKQGQRNKRLAWFQQGFLQNYRIQRFRGTSDCHMPIARLEAQLEPMTV